MKRNITIRYSASGKTNPKDWESSVTIVGEGTDEDEAERVAIRKFKASKGDIPYTVDRNAKVEAGYHLQAAARLTATSTEALQERILRQAKQMDRTPRGSKEYHTQQFAMQRLLKELRRVDPDWEDSAFDPLVWSHTGKPPRQNPNLLRAADGDTDDMDDAETLLMSDTEDPLSTGVAFDTLIDGEPNAAEPGVQRTTINDGGVEEAPEQELLNDDLVVPSIKFG